ncbi:MAG: PIN domain-containing protein [Bryobacteraceae bacterium]|nr:PIN domain-containing protein [Bryobacteraceae bacterium]
MIVVDSSVLVAFFNTRDALYDRAVSLVRRLHDDEFGSRILLEYVVIEVTSTLLNRSNFEVSRRACEVLANSEDYDFQQCSSVFPFARTDFLSQPSGKLSLVDCAIAHVARTRAQGRIATFDEALRNAPGIVGVG